MRLIRGLHQDIVPTLQARLCAIDKLLRLAMNPSQPTLARALKRSFDTKTALVPGKGLQHIWARS